MRTVKIRPYPHKKKLPKWQGYGTIQELAAKTGISVRTIYRLRLEGLLKAWYEQNPRVVLYHLERCAEEIRKLYT